MTWTTYSAEMPWARAARSACGPGKGWFATMHGKRPGGFGGFDPWAMLGHGVGWGPRWRGGPPRHRGPKARRGDVRAAILGILAEQPMNGYQLIQEITDRSRGAWKPSPGSIYPTLQQLEDEGLVRAVEQAGRRAFELTDDGHRYVESHPDEVAAPWEAFAGDDQEESGFEQQFVQTAAALWQIVATGSAEQQDRAREVIAEARRRLYGILADDEDPDEAAGTGRPDDGHPGGGERA